MIDASPSQADRVAAQDIVLPDWPMFGIVDDVRPALAQARSGGRAVVLATIYQVIGGSPRPAGSQMLIDGGQLYGFLSGGCIESDVCLQAADVLATWTPRRLIYGDGSPYQDIRLVCGGRIDILLEPLAPDDEAVQALLDLSTARREAVWVSDGLRRTCWATDAPAPAAGWSSPLIQALSDRTVGGAVLGQAIALGLRRTPPRRLVVIGADPIALAIARLAVASEFETWLVRSRGPVEPPPLQGVRYDRREADVALAAIGLDAWTSVAVATHELGADEPALETALASPAPYVGALGARRRLPERLARLRDRGMAEHRIDRLHAPIGLDLGGKAPSEVAIAVLAEIIREERARSAATWIRVGAPS